MIEPLLAVGTLENHVIVMAARFLTTHKHASVVGKPVGHEKAQAVDVERLHFPRIADVPDGMADALRDRTGIERGALVDPLHRARSIQGCAKLLVRLALGLSERDAEP